MSAKRKTSKEPTVAQLRAELKKKKLLTTGKKSDLKKRLEMYNMSKAELQKRAKAKKLPTTGTKAVLVRRIQSGRAVPPRCCNEPKRARRFPRKTTPARCTTDAKGKKYYFKGNSPHKRITNAKAKRIGSQSCRPSTPRALKRTPAVKEGMFSKYANRASKAKSLRESLRAEGELAVEEGLISRYVSALRAESLRESMRRGEYDEKSLDELNPKASADLRRSKAEVRADMLRDSASGDLSLVKVALDEDGSPLFVSVLEDKLEVPASDVDLYDTHAVLKVEKLATVPAESAAKLKGRSDLPRVPNASLIPN